MVGRPTGEPMSGHPSAEQIADAIATAPRGVWLVAGTPIDQPYPCMCTAPYCGARCPCRGRVDGPLPAQCCAAPRVSGPVVDIARAFGG